MEFIKLNKGLKTAVDMLSSSEAGDLFKAILSGDSSRLYGSTKFAYEVLKAYIEDDKPSVSEVMSERGKLGGRPKKSCEKAEKSCEKAEKAAFETEKQLSEEEESTPCPPSSPSLSPTPPIIPPIIPQPPKEEEGNEPTPTPRAREDMPFGLTETDIHQSLEADQKIEDAARGAGLNVSEYSLLNARRLADTYGLDPLLDAIQQTPIKAQKPSWSYVEGILKNPGKKPAYTGKRVSAQNYEQRPYTEEELDNGDFAALLAEARAAR